MTLQVLYREIPVEASDLYNSVPNSRWDDSVIASQAPADDAPPGPPRRQHSKTDVLDAKIEVQDAPSETQAVVTNGKKNEENEATGRKR